MAVYGSPAVRTVTQGFIILIFSLVIPAQLGGEDLILEYEIRNNPVGVNDPIYINIYADTAEASEVSVITPALPKEVQVVSGPKIDKVAHEGSFRTRIAYRLRGQQTGRYVIKPFIISAQKRDAETETFILEVGRYMNRSLYVPLEAAWEIPDSQIYVGQSVPVTLELLDLLEIPLVDEREIEPPTGAFFEEAFGIGEIERIPAGEKSLYNVPVTSYIFTPSQSGRHFLPAARVTALGQTAVSPVIRIDVLPLPAEARSSGAVGTFSYSAWVDRKDLDSGEVGVLSIEVEGTGNLKFFSMPNPDFGALVQTEVIEELDAIPVSQGYEGTRKIEYYFLSDTSGRFPIRTPDFTFFNPHIGRIRTLKGSTVSIAYTAEFSTVADSEDPFPFTLPQYEELSAEAKWGAYKRPLNYLWLLPAPLVFVILLILKRTRLLFVAAVFMLLGADGVEENECEELRPAIEAYEDGDFDRAKQGFAACMEPNGKSPALAFALALVEYQRAEYGDAMHYARNAVRLDPMHGEYRRFLTWLNGELELDRLVDPGVPIHPDIFFFSMIAFLSAGFLSAAIYLMRRKALYIVLFILGILLSAVSCGGLVHTAVRYEKTAAIVYGAPAEMRKIPSIEANTWLELSEGHSLHILESTGDFFLVRTAYGLKGWIEREDLLPDGI